MTKYESTLEQAVFESLAPKLRAEGYEVFIHPDRQLLPPFMATYRPDAIAFKPGKNLAIEVISQAFAGSPKIRNLESIFQSQEDWELRVIYSPPRGSEVSSPMEHTSIQKIQEILGEVAKLGEYANGIPALLTLWGAFEASGRILAPDEFAKPQTPGRLLEVLASQGFVTPNEADAIRDLIGLRNRAIHGNLNVSVTAVRLDEFRTLIQTLLKDVEQEASPSGLPD